MVIDYDRNPNLAPEQRIESLRENVQLALNEIQTQLDRIEKKLDERGDS